MQSKTPIIIKRVYLRAFDPQDCLACHTKTSGKICDHVSGPFGSYYTSGVPICPRCYKRVQTAVEKAEQIQLEGLR